MPQVLQAQLKQPRHMLIIERVIHLLAIAARAHNPQAAQQAQLVRHR